MSSGRFELLKNMPIFGGLKHETLALIFELASHVEVANGEFFFREGDQGNATYVLESGSVAILKAWSGKDYHLRDLGPGDCFGEVALIDFGARSASVRASEKSTALRVEPSALLRVARLDLEQYALIYMNMARELSRRLRRADERLFQAKVEAHISDEDFAFNSV
jgi:CRP-like cAMP-binding protein